jgi:hypothetical protein
MPPAGRQPTEDAVFRSDRVEVERLRVEALSELQQFRFG